MEVEAARMALNADEAASEVNNNSTQGIAEGQDHIPVHPVGDDDTLPLPCSPRDKPLSDQELLNCHEKVKELQDTSGLSYKMRPTACIWLRLRK
jgi:hypothetical protein